MGEDANRPPPKSIVIVGAGVFGLATAYSLLGNPRYDRTRITILDQWQSSQPHDSQGITPASIDNSRIVRSDYANKAYARLGVRAQNEWRAGWPLTLPSSSGTQSDITTRQPYRESGLLITCWDGSKVQEDGSLNPLGAYYVDGAYKNVSDMATWDRSLEGKVHLLKTKDEISKRLLIGGESGDRGYINESSGWADSGAAMAILRERTKERIARRNASGGECEPAAFHEGNEARVSSLEFSSSGTGAATGEPGLSAVTGVKLASSGKILSSELVLLATGAWSPMLLPRTLGSRIRASGHVVGYVELSDDEAHRLADMPVPINMSTGLFGFPPIPTEKGGYVMKVARHGWGYANWTDVENVEPDLSGGNDSGGKIRVAVPAPGSGDVVGAEGSNVLKQYLAELGLSPRPWLATRTCWYADSATCDWLMDYVPTYGARSLFVATGDSGHGFKFAPVIGEWIVRALEGRLGVGPVTSDGEDDAIRERDRELGELLGKSWRWRSNEEDGENWRGPGDGSRGGPKGMSWAVELDKGRVGSEMA